MSKVSLFDKERNQYVCLEKNKKYYAKIELCSDGKYYKSSLPWNFLKTIEANNVKVYHGIIESENSVPIKVLE